MRKVIMIIAVLVLIVNVFSIDLSDLFNFKANRIYLTNITICLVMLNSLYSKY